MLQRLLAAALAMLSLTCSAQTNSLYRLEISPADPQPDEAISVFIRAADPSVGYVLCPATSQKIIGATVTDRSVLLKVLNLGTPGGFREPFCDGNTIQIGPLPAGQYDLSANFVLADGRVVTPALATAQVQVAPLENGRNYTALWGTLAELGWGLNVSHQGDMTFATLFTYDATGAPMWLVMSSGARQGGTNKFSGDLYRTTGPAFNADPFVPIGPANLTPVGSMTLEFSGANAGTVTYTVDSVQVTKAIGKLVFGSRPSACSSTEARAGGKNYQDLWWNQHESGWGINITHQDDILFATLFTYGRDNKALWLVMSNGRLQDDGSYLGTLYQTRGPVFNSVPWGDYTINPVGSMRFRFDDSETGTLEYSIDGSTVTKSIGRQLFGNLFASCR